MCFKPVYQMPLEQISTALLPVSFYKTVIGTLKSG